MGIVPPINSSHARSTSGVGFPTSLIPSGPVVAYSLPVSVYAKVPWKRTSTTSISEVAGAAKLAKSLDFFSAWWGAYRTRSRIQCCRSQNATKWQVSSPELR
jgi:hypothetical protein